MQVNAKRRRVFLTSVVLSPAITYLSWIAFKKLLTRPIFYEFECGSKTISNNHRVLLIGDSRISNWRNHPQVSGVDFINRGVGGEKVESLIDRLPLEISCYQPNIVIFQIGINDAVSASLLSNKEPSLFILKFEKELTHLVEFCKRANIICYLSTIINPSYADGFYLVQGVSKISAIVDMMNQSIKCISNKHSVGVMDFSKKLVDSKSGLTDKAFRKDTLHINDNAYLILNGLITKLFTTLNSSKN